MPAAGGGFSPLLAPNFQFSFSHGRIWGAGDTNEANSWGKEQGKEKYNEGNVRIHLFRGQWGKLTSGLEVVTGSHSSPESRSLWP